MSHTAKADKPMFPYADAMQVAVELGIEFEDSVDRIEVMGSLRRGAGFVHDVELMMVPRLVPQWDKFDNCTGFENLQNLRVDRLRGQGILADRPDKNGRNAWGSKYQRAVHVATGIPVDLFVVTANCWGVQSIIRTGPASYSKAFVTTAAAGGQLLKPGMRIVDGALMIDGRAVPTPEELDVYRHLGIPYVEPAYRL